MLTLKERAIIWQLLESGLAAAEIARQTGRSVGTIYNIKKAPVIKTDDSYDAISPKILPVKTYIDRQIRNGAHNVHKLFLAAQQEEYEGSYALLNSYVQAHPKQNRPYKRSQHVETVPGEQAQVDWGSFGKMTVGGRIERLYAFVYVLSYSRAMYVEFVVRQNQQTLQECHMHAFDKLGIPRNIRYDNMKTVVLSRERLPDNESKDRLNPAFVDFARYYGFKIDLCPRYWPRSKGKVESAVKYLRNNFMEQQKFGQTFKDLDELNEKVWIWVNNVAQQRIHRTTEEKPYDRWQQEKRFLQFSKLPSYQSSPLLDRRSTKDGLVQYKSNFYAVPMRFSQKKVSIREVTNHGIAHLEIYYKNDLIIKYKASLERGKWALEDESMLRINDDGSKLKSPPKGPKKLKRPVVVVVPRGLDHYNNFIPNRR